MRASGFQRASEVMGRVGTAVAIGLAGVVFVSVGLTSSGVTSFTESVVAEPTPPSAGAVSPGPTTTQVRLMRPATTRPVVVLYGDSLAWESQEHFRDAFAGNPDVDVITRTFGGTAICDFLDDMRDDVATLRPVAAVVEFSGNAFTPCMMDRAGQPLRDEAFLERYRADAAALVGIFGPAGTEVYFAGAPIPRPSDGRGHFNGGKLNAMYQRIASSHAPQVQFVDAGAAVLDGGRWTETLPCLRDEPCTGGTDASGRAVDVVRAPDGDHFCPASAAARAGVSGPCPVWSSGAYRYGRAMAAPVLDALVG